MMPISTMLNLKTRFERKRSIENKWNMVYLGVCNAFRTAPLDFCATDLFPGTLIDFCFMLVEVLIKDLASVLIHARI